MDPDRSRVLVAAQVCVELSEALYRPAIVIGNTNSRAPSWQPLFTRRYANFPIDRSSE
jgi:hypothetical protein